MAMGKVAAISTLLLGVDAGRMVKQKGCGALGAVAASLGAGAASDELNMSIVNGQPANECEWKWQVGLYSRSRGPICGGTIISEEWVLTAAHCMDDIISNVKA